MSDAAGLSGAPAFALVAKAAGEHPAIAPNTWVEAIAVVDGGRSNPVIHPPAIPAAFPTKTFNPAADF